MKSSSEHKKAAMAEKKESVGQTPGAEQTAARKPQQPAPAKKATPALKAEKSNEKVVTKVRPATAEDAEWAAKLLFLSAPRTAMQLIGLGKEERSKKIMMQLFKEQGHRLSYENTSVAEVKGHRIGILVGVPGNMLGKATRKFGRRLQSFYKLNGKLALIRRVLPLAFIKEAGKQEYLISNLAVLPRYQGQGHGKTLVKAAEKKARAAGYKNMAVMVEISNTHARRVLEHLGYKVQSVVLESNKRVKLFGPGYQRMNKKL